MPRRNIRWPALKPKWWRMPKGATRTSRRTRTRRTKCQRTRTTYRVTSLARARRTTRRFRTRIWAAIGTTGRHIPRREMRTTPCSSSYKINGQSCVLETMPAKNKISQMPKSKNWICSKKSTGCHLMPAPEACRKASSGAFLKRILTTKCTRSEISKAKPSPISKTSNYFWDITSRGTCWTPRPRSSRSRCLTSTWWKSTAPSTLGASSKRHGGPNTPRWTFPLTDSSETCKSMQLSKKKAALPTRSVSIRNWTTPKEDIHTNKE